MDWIALVKESPFLSLVRLNCLSVKENSRRGFLLQSVNQIKVTGEDVQTNTGLERDKTQGLCDGGCRGFIER